jgi:hypothetical protein
MRRPWAGREAGVGAVGRGQIAIDTAVAKEVVVARPLPVADLQLVDVEVF